jgi:alpha-mannosidase
LCWQTSLANSKEPFNTLSSPALIEGAVKYPGPQTEKKLKDLLKADFHYAQAFYYLNREKAGFMAHERFELAHDRAIGDIRELSKINDDDKRRAKAIEARTSWLGGFERACIQDKPKDKSFF